MTILETQLNDAAQKVEDLQRKQAIITKWKPRLEALKMEAQDFCGRFGFDKAAFSRWINGVTVPEWWCVRAVEAAFSTEEKRRG